MTEHDELVARVARLENAVAFMIDALRAASYHAADLVADVLDPPPPYDAELDDDEPIPYVTVLEDRGAETKIVPAWLVDGR